MNCQFINENIIDFLENQLSQDDMMKYGDHLNSCPACQNLVEEIKLTYALVAKADDFKVSDDFVDKTILRLHSSQSRIVPMVYQVLKPIAVAASIGLGILIGNGELAVLNSSVYSEEESLVFSTTASTDYSVWQSLDEDYGNEN